MNSELSAILGDLISVTHRLTRLAAQATGETTSAATWRTLSVLTSCGPLRIGELAAQSRVSQPTMTKIIANLNELEWIKRIAVSNDARAWQIAMAPKGQIALESWRLRLGTALAPDFLDLSPEETMTLVRAIDLIESRLDLPIDVAAAA